ncbi:MAG: DUF2344 domain-containing protein [Anaerolineae bacterium]|nr:MAG: DUF2344 domain-containing protein [Anaerolineae bacterium]
MQRLRFSYTKGEPIKFVGHLDLARMWERPLRRAGLPVAYSQGFNPQLRIQFASALPVGCSGRAEVADLWLDEPVTPEEFTQRVQAQLPPGASVFDAHHVALDLPSLQSQMDQAEYTIQVDVSDTTIDVAAAVAAFLAATELVRVRARDGKTYDLRALVDALHVEETADDGWVRLFTRLASRPGATGRPDDLLDALGLGDLPRRIERTRLIFVESAPPGTAEAA